MIKKTYMFWQMEDNTKKKDVTLETHVLSAASYFKKKYGAYPTECLVNRHWITQERTIFNGIVVHGRGNIARNCLHIG